MWPRLLDKSLRVRLIKTLSSLGRSIEALPKEESRIVWLYRGDGRQILYISDHPGFPTPRLWGPKIGAKNKGGLPSIRRASLTLDAVWAVLVATMRVNEYFPVMPVVDQKGIVAKPQSYKFGLNNL